MVNVKKMPFRIYCYDQSFLYIKFIYLSNFNFKNKVKSLNLNVMGMNNTMTKLVSIQSSWLKILFHYPIMQKSKL